MRRKVLARIVRSAVERLEARTLMSSTLAASAGTNTIAGVVYNDVNGNGIRDAGELAVPDATVTLTEVGVTYVPGTVPTVQTDSNGGFNFSGLAAGQYNVNVDPIIGYIQDVPGNFVVTVTANNTVSVAIGETNNSAGGGSGTGTIAGTLFNDISQSGVYQPANEDFLAGDTVYLDLNGSGVQTSGDPVSTTNNLGQYTFSAAPGTYEVRAVPRPGFHIDPPGYQQVTLYSDQTVTQNIGENNRATISGTVFIDSNGNGVQDPGELPIAGEQVYIDQNFDNLLEPGTYNPTTGGFDAGEPYATSNAQGQYSFTGLLPGTYRIEISSAQNLVQNSPGYIDISVTAGQNVVQNIGEGTPSSFSGTVFDDRNGNGTMDPGDAGLPNQLVFLDNNNNGVYDQVGVMPDGLPEVGPYTTYTVPANATLTVDDEAATMLSLMNSDAAFTPPVGDLANFTLTAGGTTNISTLSASDVSSTGSESVPSLGSGLSGIIEAVNPIMATLTLSPNSTTNVSLVTATDVTNTGSGSGGGTTSGNMVTGTVVAINANAGTITLQADATQPETTYTLSKGASVTLDGLLTTLGSLNLGTISVLAAEPAQVTDINGNFTFANLGPGTYTARVVDPAGAVPTGPANATHSITFTITSGETLTGQNFGFQTPDLTTNILSIPTTPALTNVKRHAVVRITNVGSLPDIGLAGINLWAQTDPGAVNTASAYLIAAIPGKSIKLQVGQSRNFNIAFTYPTQLQENSYYVSSQVVSTVHDNNSANDFSPAVGPIQVGPPYIDLSLTAAAPPQLVVSPGQATSVSLLVTNLGNVTTNGIATFRVYLTSGPMIEPSDDSVQTNVFKNVRIKPGKSKVFNLTIPYPGPSLGLQYINVVVDSGDALGETNLLNNVLIAPYPTRFD